MIVQIVKRCKTCKKNRLLTEFGKCSDNASGIHRHCKQCINKKNREYTSSRPEKTALYKKKYRDNNHEKLLDAGAVYRETYPTRRKESTSKWAKANPHKLVETQGKRRARKESQFVEAVSVMELLLRDGILCYYCYVALVFESPSVPQSAEVEHKTPISRGGEHSYANCVLACRTCNRSKHALTEEEFIWRSYD